MRLVHCGSNMTGDSVVAPGTDASNPTASARHPPLYALGAAYNRTNHPSSTSYIKGDVALTLVPSENLPDALTSPLLPTVSDMYPPSSIESVYTPSHLAISSFAAAAVALSFHMLRHIFILPSPNVPSATPFGRAVSMKPPSGRVTRPA